MTPEQELLLNKAVKQAEETSQKLDAFLSIYYRTNFPDVMIIEKNLSVLGNFSVRDKISFFGGTPTGRLTAVTPPSGGGSGDTDAIDISGRTAINQLIARLQSLNIIP